MGFKTKFRSERDSDVSRSWVVRRLDRTRRNGDDFTDPKLHPGRGGLLNLQHLKGDQA